MTKLYSTFLLALESSPYSLFSFTYFTEKASLWELKNSKVSKEHNLKVKMHPKKLPWKFSASNANNKPSMGLFSLKIIMMHSIFKWKVDLQWYSASSCFKSIFLQFCSKSLSQALKINQEPTITSFLKDFLKKDGSKADGTPVMMPK